ASADIPFAGLLHQLVAGKLGERGAARPLAACRAPAGGLACRGLGCAMGRAPAVGALGCCAFLPAGAAAALTTTGLLVDRGPGARFGFLGRYAALFVTLLNMLSLALLFVGIAGFIASGHDRAPREIGSTAYVWAALHVMSFSRLKLTLKILAALGNKCLQSEPEPGTHRARPVLTA